MSQASLKLASRALDWLACNIDFFEPSDEEAEGKTSGCQALGELAMLSMYLQRTPTFRNDPRVQYFLSFILRVYIRPTFREKLFREDYAFLSHILLSVILRKTGALVDQKEQDIIQDLISSANIGEVLPHRALELRYIFDLGQFRHRLPSYHALCRRSALRRQLNLVRATDLDVYFITHALFHCSDFGFHRTFGLSQTRIRELRRTVDCLLGMYTHCGNWDLVGELLISCLCLRSTDSTFYSMGWQGLVEAQSNDGTIPGPYFRYEKIALLEGTSRSKYLFEECYHTTLVAALVGTLCPCTALA